MCRSDKSSAAYRPGWGICAAHQPLLIMGQRKCAAVSPPFPQPDSEESAAGVIQLRQVIAEHRFSLNLCALTFSLHSVPSCSRVRFGQKRLSDYAHCGIGRIRQLSAHLWMMPALRFQVPPPLSFPFFGGLEKNQWHNATHAPSNNAYPITRHALGSTLPETARMDRSTDVRPPHDATIQRDDHLKAKNG